VRRHSSRPARACFSRLAYGYHLLRPAYAATAYAAPAPQKPQYIRAKYKFALYIPKVLFTHPIY